MRIKSRSHFAPLPFPTDITEEPSNFFTEYMSKSRLFIKYSFIAYKRDNSVSESLIENTGSIVFLLRLKEPSPSINPNNHSLDILNFCKFSEISLKLFILFFISNI